MVVLRGYSLAFCVALAACAPKPLRFTDAATERAADVVSESSADVVDDGPRDAAIDAIDGAVDGASDARDEREASAPDAGPIGNRSCAMDPTREDCRIVAVNPTGTFCVGVDETASNPMWNASPPLCGLSLSPFYVDAHEVSVARFRVFDALWVARALPAAIDARFANGTTLRVPLPPRTYLPEWNPTQTACTYSETPSLDRDRHPINCVGWVLAMYFCAWEGGHLVTSTQYEYLARHNGATTTEGRAYPWGETAPDCALVHYGPCAGDDGLRTRRVGSLGATGSVFDLAGNVADFVADDFASYPTLAASACWTRSTRDPLCQPTLAGSHYARGSSHANSTELILRTVFRPSTASGDASAVRGFRCAYPR